MTETAFRRQLIEGGVSVKDVEEDLAFAIYLVESKTGAFIDESYPLAKFHSLCEGLAKHNKMKEKEMKKGSKKKSWR